MKKLAFGLIVIAAFASSADKVSPDQLVKDAAKYDGKEVVVKGTVIDFKQKTSKKGNPYFVFKISTKVKDSPLNVYGRGTLEPALTDKDTVEVTGTFVKEKKISTFTIKNEIDCSGKDGEKPQIKTIKH